MLITSSSENDNLVAILGFHDGNAGQIETWFERVTGNTIACFVLESSEAPVIDIEAEHIKRSSKRTAFPVNGMFKGRPFVVSLDWVAILKSMGVSKVLPLTPDNKTRRRQIEMCRAHNLKLVSAIHPTAIILDDARLADGVWINAGSIIGYKAELSEGVIINTGAQVDHHNILFSCCQLDPGVTTAGNVTIGECSHIHTGATIINRINIGEGAILGAGAVAVKDIPPNCTAVGVPARVIKNH